MVWDATPCSGNPNLWLSEARCWSLQLPCSVHAPWSSGTGNYWRKDAGLDGQLAWARVAIMFFPPLHPTTLLVTTHEVKRSVIQNSTPPSVLGLLSLAIFQILSLLLPRALLSRSIKRFCLCCLQDWSETDQSLVNITLGNYVQQPWSCLQTQEVSSRLSTYSQQVSRQPCWT